MWLFTAVLFCHVAGELSVVTAQAFQIRVEYSLPFANSEKV